MRTRINTTYDYNDFQKTVRALKAIRLRNGLSRKEAARKIGWTARSIEQLENGRCNFSESRLRKVLRAYGVTSSQFEVIREQPKLEIAKLYDSGKDDCTLKRRPRRNHLKIVTKEIRVLRTLRKRRNLSQYAASKLCGFAPSMFGHIEEGRIEMRPERISHILKCLGFPETEYSALMQSDILREDLIEEASLLLNRLEDFALSSALQVLKALVKTGGSNV